MKDSEPGLIYQKISAVMNDIEAISKDQTNRSQGFKFRGIDDVYNTLHYVMAKHGIFTVPTILNRTLSERPSKSGSTMFHKILTVQYRFFATDGSFIDCIVDGEAADSGDKVTSKCLAIAHKYALLQTFCIPTSDEKDPDLESTELKYCKPEAKPKFQLEKSDLEWLQETADKNGYTRAEQAEYFRNFGKPFRELSQVEYTKAKDYFSNLKIEPPKPDPDWENEVVGLGKVGAS